MDPRLARHFITMIVAMGRLRGIVEWMNANIETMPRGGQTYLSAYMTMIAIYMNTASRILQNPTTVQSIVGRRCIFY